MTLGEIKKICQDGKLKLYVSVYDQAHGGIIRIPAENYFLPDFADITEVAVETNVAYA